MLCRYKLSSTEKSERYILRFYYPLVRNPERILRGGRHVVPPRSASDGKVNKSSPCDAGTPLTAENNRDLNAVGKCPDRRRGVSARPPESSTEKMVRAVGVEPTRALRPCGFSYRLRLSPPRYLSQVCGLDYPFTVLRISRRRLGAARLVSTPS